jgi:hypothetical protein
MKNLIILYFGIGVLSSSIAFAGGGGSCPPPKSGDILVCHPLPSDLDSNIKIMNIYHTDGCDYFQRTFAQFDIKDLDLTYIFQLANDIDTSGNSVLGHHMKKDILVYDPHEVIGYNSSGVFADLDTKIAEVAPKTFKVEGFLHITRTKNQPANGPDFNIHGTVVCD